MSEAIEPFEIAVPQSDIDDLRDRLARTRWPEREPVGDWSQGVPLAYLQDLVRYWADEYDWPSRQHRLNAFPQFMTGIDGLDIHFVHVRSPHPDAFPLILTHGWPGSIVEFLEVIGPLTDPEAHGGPSEDAFDVVAPSLPGYAWSGKPTETGWGVGRTADAWAALMARLGYHRYGAQGGDWGSMVTQCVGRQDAEHVAGIHINMVFGFPGPDDGEPTEKEKESLASVEDYNRWDSGYSKQQSSRPQTIGYPLADSPSGQLAWILEKFWSWSDTAGDPVAALGADRILDNVMTYWLTNSAASSARMYWESFNNPQIGVVPVPVGASIFPKEIFRTSRRWAAQLYPDIRWWNELETGGHFAAFEQPETFVNEVRGFFREVR